MGAYECSGQSPPVIDNIAPASGYTTTNETLQMQIVAHSIAGVSRVTVNGNEAQRTGSNRWSYLAPLQVGSNSIEVVAITASQYKLIPGNFTWPQAKADAESRGGHLGTITSEAEWDEIQRQLGDLCGKWCWIGASDETDEGQWRWVTGEPWAYSRWCAEEPNNLNNEDYAELDGNCSRCSDSAWNDTAGKTSSYYLLETDGGQAVTATVEYMRYVCSHIRSFCGFGGLLPVQWECP